MDEQVISKQTRGNAAIPTLTPGAGSQRFASNCEECVPKSKRDFFDRSLDLNCLATPDGMFVELNQRWKDVLGYDLDALKSTPFLSLVHPDDLDSTVAALGQLAESEDILNFRNRYRRSDGTYTWLEWNSYPPQPDDPYIFASARECNALVAFEQELEQRNATLRVITQAQTEFIRSGASHAWWDDVLRNFLSLTNSEYGFIGVVKHDEEGVYLRTQAITNIAWSPETQQFYAENAPQGMVFRNTKTLFGVPMVTGKLLIANDVATDPRAGGRPEGHPPLNAFAGIPIEDESGMTGMVGLANAPGGYSNSDIEALKPALSFLSSVLRSIALAEKAEQATEKLTAMEEMHKSVLNASSTGFVVIDEDLQLALSNETAKNLIRGARQHADVASSVTTEVFDSVGALLSSWFMGGPELAALINFIKAGDERKSEIFELVSQGKGGTVDRHVEVSLAWLGNESETFPLLLTVNDITQRKALEESLRDNSHLEEKVRQLAENRQHNEVLSECVEYLQSCTTLEEGLSLIDRYLGRFYTEEHAAVLYGMFDNTITDFQRAPGSDAAAPPIRANQDCWALRSRRVYASWNGSHHMPCRHTPDDASLEFCVPLFSLDRVVAVLSITFLNLTPEEAESQQVSRLSQFIAMSQSISGALSTIALRESLQKMALTDELTGLANRRAFEDEVRRAMSVNKRRDQQFVIGILDIDHFKRINDEFGHETGDDVLRKFGEKLGQTFREGDLCGRIGGEEFAVMLQDCSAENAQLRLEALLTKIRKSIRIGEKSVTVSAGFAHSSQCGADPNYSILLRMADDALYQAKGCGRDRVVQADPGSETLRTTALGGL